MASIEANQLFVLTSARPDMRECGRSECGTLAIEMFAGLVSESTTGPLS